MAIVTCATIIFGGSGRGDGTGGDVDVGCIMFTVAMAPVTVADS